MPTIKQWWYIQGKTTSKGKIKWKTELGPEGNARQKQWEEEGGHEALKAEEEILLRE